MLETYVLEIDKNLEMADFNKLMNLVSEEKRKRIDKFHFFEDAQRSLLGDVLAR